MFQNLALSPSDPGESRSVHGYTGPDRRAPAASELGHCMTRMLDEIDYGMVLVSADAQVVYLNHAARLELDGEHPLQLLGSALRAQRPQDVAPLHDALASAQRGLRKLVMLGAGAHRVSISVVPLPGGSLHAQTAGGGQGGQSAHSAHSTQGAHTLHPHHDDPRPTTLLVLGKRQVCEQLSVQGYARNMRLTPAETRVLELLCTGVRPTQIARQQNVEVSTVRTQLGAIRNKTGADGINDLVRQVAVLPPLLTVLRGGVGMGVRTVDTAQPGTGAGHGVSGSTGTATATATATAPHRGMGSMVGAAVVAALGVAMGATMGSALAAR